MGITITDNKRLIILGYLMFGMVVIFGFGVNTSSAAISTTIYVSPHGNDSWDGHSSTYNSVTKSGPKATIKNATKSVLNGMIYVERGTYHENGIIINNNMTIKGQAKTTTIIDGDKKGGIFIISTGSNMEIMDISLINGNSDFGGAIKNSGKLTVTNTYLGKNQGGSGGAVWNNGTIKVTSSTFDSNIGTNSSYGGGAIHNDNHGILTLENSNFTKNISNTLGGAVFNAYNALCTVKSCNFTGNYINDTPSSSDHGGAIANSGVLDLSNTVFNLNNAEYGGALFNENKSIINNCTFISNSASNGGAIYSSGYLNLTNSTLTKNFAVNYGGCFAGFGGNANINFNRIIGNSAVQGSGVYTQTNYVNANYNWWGSNSSPSSYIYGNVNADKWMVLRLITNSRIIKNGTATNVTASLLYDNNNVKHDPSKGYIPNGVTVVFSGNKGILKPATTYTVNGQALTIYTPSQTGISTIVAKMDNQTLNCNLTVVAPLKINGTTPKNGAVNVAPNTRIQVKFNQNIKRGTMYIDLVNPSGIHVSFSTSIINNTLTVIPKSSLITGKYSLILHTGSVLSQLNSSLSLYKLNFTADATAPKFVSSNPKNLQTSVSQYATVSLKFSENLQKGVNFSKISVKNLGTGKLLTTNCSITKNSVLIKTSSKSKNTWYLVSVPGASVKDFAGNNLKTSYTFRFKT